MAVANGNTLHASVLENLRKLSGQGNSAFTYDRVAEGVEQDRKAGRQILPQDERFALQEAVLAYWNDLLRAGIISFGRIDHWDSNVFHLTAAGRKTLEQLGRDPINPDGYMLHLQKCATLDSISGSYIREALHTYQAGCHKATAVMVGTAAEGMILHLRDIVVARLRAAKKKVLKDMEGMEDQGRLRRVGRCVGGKPERHAARPVGGFRYLLVRFHQPHSRHSE